MPEEPAASKVSAKSIGFNELGRSGLKRMGGLLYEEFLPQLQGTLGVRRYIEMRDNSAIIGASLSAIESMLRQASWRVEPASDDPADLEAAEFLETCRHDMSHTWEDFISEVLTMLVFGWSFFEIVYKRRKGPDRSSARDRSKFDDGRIGWRKFAPRAQETLFKWEFDADGGIKGMYQQIPPSGDAYDLGQAQIVYLPIEKCLLFRTTSQKNSPEGRSILRNAYRSWHYLSRLQEIEAVGAERNLAGMPIAYVPLELLADDRSDAATSTYNTIKDIVTRTKRDEQEGIIFPIAYDEDGKELFRFELMAAGGTGGKAALDVRGMINGYTQEIAMSMMTDFLLIGHEATGSFALSSDKTEMFSIALGAWLGMIQDTINRHAVPRLFEVNDFDIEDYPRIVHGDVETPNLPELGGFLQNLSSAGAMLFPDLLLENRLRQAADLPEIDPETYEERLAEKQAQQEMMMGQMAGPGGPQPGGGEPGGAPPGRPMPPGAQGRPGQPPNQPGQGPPARPQPARTGAAPISGDGQRQPFVPQRRPNLVGRR